MAYTNQMKLDTVQSQIPELSKGKAQKLVRFLNWQQKWDAELNIMFKAYQIDTNDKELPFIGFAEFIYENDKELPKDYINNLIQQN